MLMTNLSGSRRKLLITKEKILKVRKKSQRRRTHP